MIRQCYGTCLLVVLAGCAGNGGGERAPVEDALLGDAPADVPVAAEGSVASASDARTAVLRVDGMTWPLCATTLETSLRRLTGVQDVRTSLGRGEIDVEFVAGFHANEKELRRTVDSSGFTLRSIQMPGKR